jgi:dTDP-glucose 4,6-dehydratase
MNLLVTGGCGFIGSNFINYYFHENLNVNIINLDAMYYCASESNIKEEIRNSDRYTLVRGNLCSMDLIRHILETNKIDTVIHFAAQSHVQNSFDDSLQYTNDNVLGTHTLLEASRKYGKIVRFIHISTDEVYGESMISEDEEKKTESTVLCPTNPYAATKAAAELIAKSYYFSFKMPIIITRGNNVYGPNQYPEKLIPRFIDLLNKDQKVTIQGDGTNLRAFLHVLDVCSGLKIILEKGAIGEIYNIGSDVDHEYSVTEIAHKLIKLIKHTDNYDEWISYIEDRPFNDKRYHISNDKLKQLGWTINIDFDEGLKNLISKSVDKPKNIIIFNHMHFEDNNGGMVAQYELARLLDKYVKNVRIYPINGTESKQNQIFNKFYNNDFPIDNDCVVIYCEGTHGNPLNAEKVVRWILSPLGKNVPYDWLHSWGKNELVYYFNSELKFLDNPEKISSVYKLLNSIYIAPFVKQSNFKEREGTCHTYRKYYWHNGVNITHNSSNSFEITRLHTMQECVDIFNKYKYFYSYDPCTFLSIISALCGCISIVHPLEGKNKEEWIQSTAVGEYCKSKGLFNLYGIAYGMDDLEYAENTIHLVKEQWDDILKFNEKQLIIPFINDINNFDNMQNTIQNNYF